MERTPSDPVVDEIRAVRHQISARFDHDPERLMAYYVALQEEHRDRLIPGPGADAAGPGGRMGRDAAAAVDA